MMKFFQRITAICSAYFITASVAFAQIKCTGNNGELCNPLSNEFSTIPNFIAGALKILVMVALPIITIFIVYSGFLFVTAQGKPGELENAKQNFFFVIIGALLIMSAWILATLIGGTVTQLTGGA